MRVVATDSVRSAWESVDLSVVSCAGRRLAMDSRTIRSMSFAVIAVESGCVRLSGSSCLLMVLRSVLRLLSSVARGSVRRGLPLAL